MLPPQDRMERLSVAYLTAVSGRAGWKCSFTNGGDYGIDATVHYIARRGTRIQETGHNLDFQLKSTTTATIEGDEVVYDLEAKNYNDLVDTDVGTARLLLLLCLPQDESTWLSVCHDYLQLKNCAYWYSLRGEDRTDNEYSRRIRIPRSQVLDASSLTALMELVRQGEYP